MSAAFDETALRGIIASLTSPDTEAIAKAEQQIDQIKQGSPDQRSQLCLGLLRLLCSGSLSGEGERQMGSILLESSLFPSRKDSSRESEWTQLPQNVCETIKAELLNYLNAEQSKTVIRTVVTLVGNIADVTVLKGQWNGLFPFMFTHTQSKEVLVILFYLYLICFCFGWFCFFGFWFSFSF